MNAAGAFLGGFSGAGDGTNTALALPSQLHGREWPRKKVSAQLKLWPLITMSAGTLIEETA